MDAVLGMLLDGDLASQARGEFLHLAFLAIAGGASIICTSVVGVITFLLRRDLKRSEDEKRLYRADVNGRLAKLELGTAVLDEKIDVNKDRHGREISDIKIAMAPLFTKAELPQPHYESR